MNELPRNILIQIIAQYGPGLVDEPRRVEGLLKDLCGEHKREISALMDTMKVHAPQELRAAFGRGLPAEVLVATLTQRMLDDLPIGQEMARWAVESWAIALGVAEQPAAPQELEQPPAPPALTPISQAGTAVPENPERVERPQPVPGAAEVWPQAAIKAGTKKHSWLGWVAALVVTLIVLFLVFSLPVVQVFLGRLAGSPSDSVAPLPSTTPSTLVIATATSPATLLPAATATKAATMTAAPVATATTAAASPTTSGSSVKLKVGLVTDTGGVNDKSFNQSAWTGVQKAATEFGWDAKFIESKQPTDYEKNIDQFATEKYDMIVTVGFLMGDATAIKAKQYPNIKFAMIDNAYYPTKDSKACDDKAKDCYDDGGLKNVASLMFQEDEVGFLAGVLAAGMSKTGVVCSVAGMEIPPVVRFVVGYQAGAKWMKPATQALNVYIPSFVDPAKGKETGQSMIAQKCDVVFGVGGNTGNGGLLAAKEKSLMAIGVDVDQYGTYAEVKDALLSSAAKNVDVAVYENLKALKGSSWKAGIITANLKNGGVGLAPFHDWDSKIPADVKAKITEATNALKAGTLATGYKP